MKNRIIRAALTVILVAATALAGVVVPAAHAQAAGPSVSEATSQDRADPTFTVDRSKDNAVVLTMKGGKGSTARLKMTANGKETVWTARAKATSNTYKVTVPFPVAANGFVTVVPASVRNKVETVYRGAWTFWCTPTSAPKPAPKPAPAPAPKMYLDEYHPQMDWKAFMYGVDDKKTKYLQFHGTGFAGTKILLQQKKSGAWKTVWTSKVVTDEYSMHKTKFKFASKGSATLRAKAVKGGKTIATSKTVTVRYVAPNRW